MARVTRHTSPGPAQAVAPSTGVREKWEQVHTLLLSFPVGQLALAVLGRLQREHQMRISFSPTLSAPARFEVSRKVDVQSGLPLKEETVRLRLRTDAPSEALAIAVVHEIHGFGTNYAHAAWPDPFELSEEAFVSVKLNEEIDARVGEARALWELFHVLPPEKRGAIRGERLFRVLLETLGVTVEGLEARAIDAVDTKNLRLRIGRDVHSGTIGQHEGIDSASYFTRQYRQFREPHQGLPNAAGTPVPRERVAKSSNVKR